MKPKSWAAAWGRWLRNKAGGLYFVYPPDRPNTWKLLDTGQYGVVQLICIEHKVREAFAAGYRAGRRAQGKDGKP